MLNRPCHACDNTGFVADIHGQKRPCSRCQNEAFSRWSDARRPQQPTPGKIAQ